MKKLMILLLVTVTLLTGCSKYDPNKPVNVGWSNGEILYDGKPTGLTEYTGMTAQAKPGQGGQDYYFTFNPGTSDASNINENTQGVLIQDMDKFKDKYYYTEYLGSKFTMAQQIADNTFDVCQVYLTSGADVTAKYASDYMDTFCLTETYYKVDFGDFYFGSGYEYPKITNEGASISGVAKVTAGSKGASEPFEYTDGKKTYQMLTMTSERGYTYYEYNGLLIQLAPGITIYDYIEMK